MTVGTAGHCYGEATALVEASSARHGPKGSAAGFRADLSEEVTLAATFTISGTCRTASSFSFTGGAGPDARQIRLPRQPKRLAFKEEDADARRMQKRASLARPNERGRLGLPLLIGLALAGSAAGGMTVGTAGHCYGEATALVEASSARHGPKGSAAGFRAASDG